MRNLKEQAPHLIKWQIAYAARELRHKKSVTVSCLTHEATSVIEQLSSFSNSYPVMKKTLNKPGSKEVFIEIVDVN